MSIYRGRIYQVLAGWSRLIKVATNRSQTQLVQVEAEEYRSKITKVKN